MWRSLQNLATSRSLRSLAQNSRRHFCNPPSTTPTSAAYHKRVTAFYEDLLDHDWVDTDKDPVELVLEKADKLIDEYRPIYKNADEPRDEELYKSVENLYIAKEAASICDAYADMCERTMRRHEGVLGFMGDNNNISPELQEQTIQLFHDYIAFMGTINDEEIKTKVELELGRKLIHLKMFVAKENFSLYVAPIAGDRILPATPRPKQLPKEEQTKELPSSK